MLQGLHYDISNEDYHGGEGISKSGLDLVMRSPLHYFDKYLRPKTDEEKAAEREAQAAHFKVGTAIHTAILEPEEWNNRYILLPEDAPKRPSSTQLKAKKPSDETLYAIGWWDDFDAKLADGGLEVLSPSDWQDILTIARAARESRIGKRVFSGAGVAEVSVFWTDEETGVLCKCRPDWLLTPDAQPAIVDVKSTRDAHPDSFAKSSWNFNYDMAAAWYLDGYERATGTRPDSFLFLATEKTRPFAHAWYYADEGMILSGRRKYRKALDTYAECKAKGIWPGYPDKLQALSLPAWAERKMALDA